jgi:oligopeptide/dipeptide ABC transporter ATP-binding protein
VKIAMSEFLKISDLTVEYRVDGSEQANVALDRASLIMPNSGYTLGLVGESGSGKTTLGLSILRMIESPGRIVDGAIEFQGSDVLALRSNELREYRWRDVAMVYQSAMNSLNPVSKVKDPIEEVLRIHAGVSKNAAWKKASSLLSEVGIDPARARDYPHEFSGGMRQRVVIALALALSPKLLIADEPTSALDVVVQKQILALLRREIREKNLSLLFITHDISILTEVVENVAVMYAGEVVETGPAEKVLFEPLHPYTEMLLSSLLTLDSDESSLDDETKLSQGKHQSDEINVAWGNQCKYVTTCKYAFGRCKTERPSLRKIDKGRTVACHKYN